MCRVFLLNLDLDAGFGTRFRRVLISAFHSIFKDMKWIEEKQALYRRNQELVEKVRPALVPEPGWFPGERAPPPSSQACRAPQGCAGLAAHLGLLYDSLLRAACLSGGWKEAPGPRWSPVSPAAPQSVSGRADGLCGW